MLEQAARSYKNNPSNGPENDLTEDRPGIFYIMRPSNVLDCQMVGLEKCSTADCYQIIGVR